MLNSKGSISISVITKLLEHVQCLGSRKAICIAELPMYVTVCLDLLYTVKTEVYAAHQICTTHSKFGIYYSIEHKHSREPRSHDIVTNKNPIGGVMHLVTSPKKEMLLSYSYIA